MRTGDRQTDKMTGRSVTSVPTTGPRSTKGSALLWTGQGALALLFLMAGSMKLVTPVEEVTRQLELPGLFLRFIGVCEVLGGLGLVLPGVLRFRPGLTPLAAAGLAVIMTGATVLTLAIGGGATALMPFVVGLVVAANAYGRRGLLADRLSAHRPAPQPAG